MYRTALLVFAVLASAPAMAGDHGNGHGNGHAWGHEKGKGHDKGHGNGHAKHGCEDDDVADDDDDVADDDDAGSDDEVGVDDGDDEIVVDDGGSDDGAASDDMPNAVRSASVRIQLQTTQQLISLMDRSQVRWRDNAGFEDAKDLLREAREANRAGRGQKAGRLASDAWVELAPAFREWIGKAQDQELRAVNKTLIDAGSERIALMKRSDVDLSAAAASHVDQAERAHAEAIALRDAGDARGAANRERIAIRQLDLALTVMVSDRSVASAD